MSTEREALDRIAALLPQPSPLGGVDMIDADEVRAILTEVTPEPGGDPYCRRPSGGERCGVCGSRQSCYPEPGDVLDRDQAREVLAPWLEDATDLGWQQVLDALARCVRPAAIDRDAVRQVLALYSWRDDMLDYVTGEILALVRPVAGVTLTPEEAALAAYAIRGDLEAEDFGDNAELERNLRALAARLEATS